MNFLKGYCASHSVFQKVVGAKLGHVIFGIKRTVIILNYINLELSNGFVTVVWSLCHCIIIRLNAELDCIKGRIDY